MSTTFLKTTALPFVVGYRARRRVQPVDEECRHLHFRKRAPHPVAVDDGQAGIGGRQNRLDRIGPADFRRNQRGTAHAQGLLDCAQSAKTFLALLDLFDAYDRRADAADRSDPIVVADRLQQQDFSTEAPWRSNSRALSMPI